MSSQTDQLVDDVKTYIDIIRNHIDARHTKTVHITKEGFEPFLSKFEELANEVSILEAERVRLTNENAALIEQAEQLNKTIVDKNNHITVLNNDIDYLEKNVKKMKELNINQSKMIMLHYDESSGFSKYKNKDDSTSYAMKA